MDKMTAWVLTITICIEIGYVLPGPVLPRLHGGPSYLPPLPGSIIDHTNLPQSPLVDTKHIFNDSNSYTTSYKTNHNFPNSLLKNPKIKSESSYSRTYHNSYAPQPSGIGLNVFPPLTPSPLPSLIPNTVREQLISTSSTTFPSPIINSIDLSLGDNKNDIVKPPSIIMVDSSMKMLTPSQNQTIYAAKLLASSLLQEDAQNSLKKDGFLSLEPHDINKVDSKDMFILKVEKNAYITPSNTNPMDIHELYNMRNKLDKAYTINQFIFIIKPEHINFLNKLV